MLFCSRDAGMQSKLDSNMGLATSKVACICVPCGLHLQEPKAMTLLPGCPLQGEIMVLEVISETFRVGLG